MPRYEERLWPGDPAGQTRADREPFRYPAYIPDEIGQADFPATGPLAQAISKAERSVGELNDDPPALKNLEAVARQLLRAESVASSRIEGLEMSHKRLAQAAYGPHDGRDETARSVLGNIQAMEQAIELGTSARGIRADDICSLHEILMTSTRDAHIAGRVRDTQNWIGGSSFSPRGAEFVPPPPELVDALLEDLAEFMNREDLPAVQQAAIAHAQFETIHPFGDGNGRIGRCLTHVILRRRGLAARYVPPISLVLAAYAEDYVRGLTAYREDRASDWALFFANATDISSREARTFAGRIAVLQERWREQVGARRQGAGSVRLIEELPAQPIIDSKAAHALLGGTQERARLALTELERSGVLQQVTIGRRNRAWQAVGLYEALNDFERQLATQDGKSNPSRPVPR